MVDNAHDGFNLHDLEDAGYVRTFFAGVPSRQLPRQVAFAEKGKVVVGGSDQGVVYVFDRCTGAVVDRLNHARTGWIGTVTVECLMSC